MNQFFGIIGIFLLVSSCKSVLSDKENGFSEEFVKYLENTQIIILILMKFIS